MSWGHYEDSVDTRTHLENLCPRHAPGELTACLARPEVTSRCSQQSWCSALWPSQQPWVRTRGRARIKGCQLYLSSLPVPNAPFFPCLGGSTELGALWRASSFGSEKHIASFLRFMTSMPLSNSSVQEDWLSPHCKCPF